MTIAIKAEQGHAQVSIQDELTIYSAAEMKQALFEALCQFNSLDVDLEAIQEIDMAGVQLLLMLRNESVRLEKKVQLTKHSPAVIDVLETLNLVATLGDPILLPAGEK
ncbi:STAS domain-containing protein [Vibrio navarrensis]|uniref:STAS domain-containing protein n=1 Tax=Vibrio navarrensis TaxID=29495 RepID=UPI000580439E|nr:STAS domain-containing protein [Vibrio navarrensis]